MKRRFVNKPSDQWGHLTMTFAKIVKFVFVIVLTVIMTASVGYSDTSLRDAKEILMNMEAGCKVSHLYLGDQIREVFDAAQVVVEKMPEQEAMVFVKACPSVAAKTAIFYALAMKYMEKSPLKAMKTGKYIPEPLERAYVFYECAVKLKSKGDNKNAGLCLEQVVDAAKQMEEPKQKYYWLTRAGSLYAKINPGRADAVFIEAGQVLQRLMMDTFYDDWHDGRRMVKDEIVPYEYCMYGLGWVFWDYDDPDKPEKIELNKAVRAIIIARSDLDGAVRYAIENIKDAKTRSLTLNHLLMKIGQRDMKQAVSLLNEIPDVNIRLLTEIDLQKIKKARK
ncbi:MAG: hypothetical protein M1269_10385 [Chloroflexi bacterium]|nr:hypothetical protein [Chloroflexota bacterium]